MPSYPKVAVTLPPGVFAGLERARRRLGKTRSAAIALAVEDWLRMVERGDGDRRYAAGYARHPEADLAWAEAASAGSTWGTWSHPEATRGARAAEQPASSSTNRRRPRRARTA